MVLLLLLLATPIILIYLLQKHKKNCESLEPPGPPGLPLIGNLYQFSSSAKPHEYLWQLSKKYGPLMSMRFGSVPVLIISSARIAKQAMTTYDLALSGRPQFIGLQKMSYAGLDVAFTGHSDYWREMKKFTVLHLYNVKRVQSFCPIREDEVSNMIRKIAELAASSQSVDLSEILTSTISNIICRVAFGKRFGEGLERKRFSKLLHEGQAMMAAIYYSDCVPALRWIDKISGLLRRLEKNFEEFDAFYEEIIVEHLNPNRLKLSEDDIVDILFRRRNEKSSPFDVTLDHIKANLMNVLFGGTDTATAIMVWVMTTLVKYPTIMEKLKAEIRQSVGKKDMVNEDDIQKLPYFKAVIKETMRLYPPSPLLVPRVTIQKVTIDGYEIQPNTAVYFNVWAIGRDPEYWESPHEFMPERFLHKSIEYKGQDFGFIPFGGGRRGCPGIFLGMAMVELALANLVYSFDWDLPSGMNKEDVDMDVLPGFTMHKKNPLCLVPHIRDS